MSRALALALALAGTVAAGMPGFGVLVNQDGSFGISVAADPTLREWNLKKDAGTISIRHSLDAAFGSKLESLPNHVYGDLDGVVELLDWPGRNWVFDATVRGARLEATQDFGEVDFAMAGEVSLFRSNLFHFVFNALNPGKTLYRATPVCVTLGYSQLFELEDADTLGPGWTGRLHGEVFLTIPVTERLSLAAHGRAFNQPADAFDLGSWKWMLEPVMTFQWNDKWMHIKYERGSLPPSYEPVDNWTIGAGFAFD